MKNKLITLKKKKNVMKCGTINYNMQMYWVIENTTYGYIFSAMCLNDNIFVSLRLLPYKKSGSRSGSLLILAGDSKVYIHSDQNPLTFRVTSFKIQAMFSNQEIHKTLQVN